MTTRSTLLSQITTNLTGSNVSVSQELPWLADGVELYKKNKKHFYLSEESESREEFIKTLDKSDVEEKTITLNGYLVVDAKNQPGDITSVVANIMSANSSITNTIDNSVSYETTFEGDDIIYTFEYNFITIT
jgi:heterodisulfide reductase subunit A-like polyferredoxin